MSSPLNQPLDATQPGSHAAVIASAGTGKTWLLITRIVRLLLSNVEPEHVLAITFTRKAATEIQSRLRERLYLLASCEPARLHSELAYIGVEVTDDTCSRARLLYQQLLMNPYPLRTTTFHAFCHELLKRFPLEADVPAGFELLEATRHIEEQAMDALFNEASLNTGQVLAQALEYLLQQCETLHSLQSALREFLNHRSDWWAYVEDHTGDFAHQKIMGILDISPDTDPLANLSDAGMIANLQEFSALLRKNTTKTNVEQADAIDMVTGNAGYELESILHDLCNVFFTKQGEPRKRKISKKLEQLLGESGVARFIELDQLLCEWLGGITDCLKRHATYKFSSAWYVAGTRYLQHYQRIKQELRYLDFSDLEWQTCQLLNRSDNAHWIQYKLDQKIQHILIDEFQDTNPTQWRLLHPILSEISSTHESDRSVFLVGDSKQSIYSFRRANPRLLTTASEWMNTHLGAKSFELDASRRSSTAIMDMVNAVFSTSHMQQYMTDYHEHTTCRDKDWGFVEIFPAIPYSKTDPEPPQAELRNPLIRPRPDTKTDSNYIDGCRVAEKIISLIEQRPLVSVGDIDRPLEYSDILLLIRNRTHAPSYERALREHHIPYTGADRGTLLHTLEVQDILAILKILVTPYDNLALAQALRSPVFSVTDDDLVLIAKSSGDTWIEKLYACSRDNPSSNVIACACEKIARWSGLADRLPVHDLLDHIYFDANIVERYLDSYPAHLHTYVVSNLKRLIELALDIDSGRYPSISSFIQRLSLMRAYDDESVDSHMGGDNQQRVRLMTIHAAKGLEAPVVFLLDSARQSSPSRSFHTIVNWPATDDKPDSFLITGKKSERDSISNTLLDRMNAVRDREECNLLYVALTRARQMLFITGCEPRHGINMNSWYALSRDALSSIGNTLENGNIKHDFLSPAYSENTAYDDASPVAEVSTHGLSSPIHPKSTSPSEDGLNSISPSMQPDDQYTDAEFRDCSQRLRGNIIHRILQLLTEGAPDDHIKATVASQFSVMDTGLIDEAMDIAHGVLTKTNFSMLFDDTNYSNAYNEMPLQYGYGENTVFGYPDRIVVSDTEVLIIDYKTHINADSTNLSTLAEPYKKQMDLYKTGAEKIWPTHKVRTLLLFTQCADSFELQ